ncbi:hypothetical protein ACHAQJ_003945 [Trichoderma viride]
MDPLSAPVSPRAPSSGATAVPEAESFTVLELNDSEYFTEVLRLPLGKSETEADQELLARANATGIAATLPSVASQRHPASSCSASSFSTQQDRTFSDASNRTNGTAVTTRSSVVCPPSPLFDSEGGERRGSTASLTFSHYERYLASIDSGSKQDKPVKDPLPIFDNSAKSVVSVSPKRGNLQSLRDRMLGRKKKIIEEPIEVRILCVSCRDSFGTESGALHKLQCGHIHCIGCVKKLIHQAIEHESQMPPSCCSRPLIPSLVRAILNQDDQENFLLAVLKVNTPADERVFCPEPDCGHFIPPKDGHDPKHPFDLTCVKCSGRRCVICMEAGHELGENCPQDWELAVLRKKEQQQHDKESWKRCYECRSLVELNGASPYATCRCEARFCSVCVGIWDPTTGCPNLCCFEEEMQRRRITATLSSMNELRLRANSSIQQLGQEQQVELRRFLEYKSQNKDALQTRHLMQEAAVEEKYEIQEEKLLERHERDLAHMEDRHLAAELELHEQLNQDEQNLHFKLKHMEAYCNGLGRNPNSSAPQRIVTEQDLRELGYHYHLRDNIDQTRESKINVMRERQARQLADRRAKQDRELETFMDKRQKVLDKMEAQFLEEETLFNNVFDARQSRLQSRWVLAIEVLCKELEEQNPNQIYRRVAAPKWPKDRTL